MKNMKPERCVWLVAILALVAITTAPWLLPVQPVSAQAVDAPWPMWRHDAANTGASDALGPSTLAPWEGGVKWKFETGGAVCGSASVAYGKVYFGSYDWNLYCLDAESGSLVWKYTTDWKVRSSPAIVDGKVYTGADDGYIKCLDADTGKLVWKTPTEGGLTISVIQPVGQITSSPTVVGDKLYVGHLDSYIYCLDITDGTIIWKYKTRDRVVSSPAVAGGRIFVGSCDHHIYAFRESDGKFLWRRDLYDPEDNPHPSSSRSEVTASPCVVNDTVYIFGNAGYWFALDAETGDIKWRYFIKLYRGEHSITQAVPAGSVAYGDGRVYFVDNFEAAAADALTGEILWWKSVGFVSYGSTTYAEGRVYIGSDMPGLFCFDAESGEQLSSYTTPSYIRSSPSVGYGYVYIGCGDYNLYCFQEAPPKPPSSITAIPSAPEVSPVPTTGLAEINITGTITPTPMAEPEVWANFSVWHREELIVRTTMTYAEPNGTYVIPFEPYRYGTWNVTVWWEGDDLHDGTSTLTSFDVVHPPSGGEQWLFIVGLAIGGAFLYFMYRRSKRLEEEEEWEEEEEEE